MVIGSVRNNISALQIINQLYQTDDRIGTNLNRISSGLRIRSAKDDPGGYVLSNRLHTQFRGLSRASENTQDLISLTTTGIDATNQIISLLNDIRDAAVSASGGSATQQAVIQEKLEELNRIATTTRYNDKYLLNGSLTTSMGFKSGTRNFGGSLSFGPNATTLLEGRSYLNIGVTDQGTAQIQNGGDATYNTGVSPSTDRAVSVAQFMNGGVAAVAGDSLSTLTANRVDLNATDVLAYSGYLANGTTFFSGAFSITGGNTVGNLITAIQDSIDAAEANINVDGTGTLETTVSLSTSGRLRFSSGTAQNISEFDVSFTLKDSADAVKTSFDITRDTTVYNPQDAITATGALIGNNYTAITGSTFDSGTFTIAVSNIVAAQQRQIQTDDQFRRNAVQPALPGTQINGSLLNGVTLFNGDTFQINGTDPDGSTFTTTYTIGVDTGVGDGIIETYNTLIAELNNRDRSLTSIGFNDAIATLSNGYIRLHDDIADESSTNLQIIVAGTQTVNSTVMQTGSRATATVSIDGGTSQEVTTGQVVTLQGVNSAGGPKPEVTFRVGNTLTAGNDQLQTTAKEYVGQLNSGTAVTFQNGDQGVRFESGTASIYPIQRYQQVTLDFDAILDITDLKSDGGETFVISTTTNAANFQIGGDRGDLKQFLFADLRSQNLGTNATDNLDSINVTTATGATDALAIIDDALDQVNEFAGRLGAFSSRLDDTVAVLDAGSLNLEDAYTQIVSTDVARETTELTLNTVLLQAQSAVLVQANALPQAIMKIMFDLD